MTRQIDIADALEAYDADAHRKGNTLPKEQKLFRAKVHVVTVFMNNGIPFGKQDNPD